MSTIVALKTRLPVKADPVPAAATLPAWKTDHLDRRLGQLTVALEMLREGASDAAAAHALVVAGMKKATAGRRVKVLKKALETGDFTALAPQWKRPRKEQPWHAEAIELIQLPSKPNSGEIAFQLRGRGYDVTVDQVRAYKNALPSNLAETSKKRLGSNYYKLNHSPHVIRDFSGVPVGYQYESDGHTCDFYAEHPTTGGHFQPELTFWYDVRSQFIVDFWISGFENSFDIRMSLSRALLRWDHVPREVRVDNGAYKAKVLVDEAAGYCEKLKINPHFAISRNARSKCVEGEWALFRGRCSKFQPTFVHNRTDDFFKAFARKWANNEVPKLSLRQCYDVIAQYVDQRNNEHRKALKALDGSLGATPAEVWAGLKANPVLVPATAICRPRVRRTVQNRRVRLDNRVYQAPELIAYESNRDDMRFAAREVVVEYDDWHDQRVWVYDLRGNFICVADLVEKRAGIPESRVEQRMAKTLEGQVHRLQVQLAEKQGRAQQPLSGSSMLDAIEGEIVTPLAAASHSDATVLGALEAGHNFTPAAKPVATLPRPARQPLAETEQRLVAAIADSERVDETPTQRYQRWVDLQAAGQPLGDLAAYHSSSECRSFERLREEFGAISGINLPVTPQGES